MANTRLRDDTTTTWESGGIRMTFFHLRSVSRALDKSSRRYQQEMFTSVHVHDIIYRKVKPHLWHGGQHGTETVGPQRPARPYVCRAKGPSLGLRPWFPRRKQQVVGAVTCRVVGTGGSLQVAGDAHRLTVQSHV
uniref:Uncharacterized protein n=1 Tax=Branchiostoma floridae TaxID=7739 RepID=C3Z3V9_BRAFL|eukprot:XP_002596861.1 hypothetical protein BRAFLDRAFT_99763 [Branchiostoma floridae]